MSGPGKVQVFLPPNTGKIIQKLVMLQLQYKTCEGENSELDFHLQV